MRDLPPDAERIYKDIRKRVKDKYDKRKEFAIHLAMFLMAMFGIWNVLSLAGLFKDLAGIFSVLWGMGLIAHFLDFYFHELQEREIQVELGRAGIAPQSNKLKNTASVDDERYVRLSDDGELIDIDPLEADDYPSEASGLHR